MSSISKNRSPVCIVAINPPPHPDHPRSHFSMLCPSGRLAQSRSTHFDGSKSGDSKSEGSSATVIFFNG